MITLTIQERGMTAAQGRMIGRSRQMRSYMMTLLYSERAALQRELRAQAPKKTGIFAQGIQGLLHEDAGGQMKLEMISGGEHAYLLPWIVHGTRPHIIPRGGSAEMMAKGYPLRFYWAKGPKGAGIYYFWHVHHPGTKPNDFIGRAMQVRYPKLQSAFRKGMMEIASARYTGGAVASAQE